MSHLNSKWETFRYSVEIGSAAVAMFGTWVWSYAAATAERGYTATGSEVLLSVGAAVLVGIVLHKIMNKAEGKLNERIAEEERRSEAIRKASKARMYTLYEAERKRTGNSKMFSVGE